MSFRARLRIFFAMIVIVPMVAIGVSLFSITASSERGKTDAGLATALTVAFATYDEGRIAARAELRRIADDSRLTAALARGDSDAARRRLRSIVASDPEVVSAIVVPAGEAAIRAGFGRGVAPAAADLQRSGGGRIGTLGVSVTDARALARTVRTRTGRNLLVLRDGRAAATTVPAVRSAPSGSADLDAGGREYRTRRAAVLESRVAREDLVVFADASELNDAIGRNQLLVVALLLAFLLLALASSVFVSRALQAQIGTFLEAARRLAGGRFDVPVPVEGRDEFAQLGREFNSMSVQLENQIAEVQRKRRELDTAIRRVGKAFASGLDRQGIFDLAVQNAVQACEADGGRGRSFDPLLLQETSAGAQDRDLHAAMEEAERRAVERGNRGDRDTPALVEHEGVHGMALPLKARLGTAGASEYLGAISLARRARAFHDEESELLQYLVGQAMISIENADLHETVQRQAITDELTRLSNVRQMHRALDREFERGQRFDAPVGIVLLDIDDFKAVNDTYGHPQGDAVLAAVAAVLRDHSRDIDEPARYGGEEMAVVLPQTGVDGAAQLAERMRAAIEALRVPRVDGKGDLRVTASFGVASMAASTSDKGSLVAAADGALYRAKRAGKNRVERADTVTA